MQAYPKLNTYFHFGKYVCHLGVTLCLRQRSYIASINSLRSNVS